MNFSLPVLILLLCGSCGVLCAIVPVPIVAVYALQVSLVCGLATTVLSSITVDIFPTQLRAMAICISLMCGRIGSVTGTNVVGVLLENHCKTGLLIAGVSLILSGVLAFLLPKTSKKPINENDVGAWKEYTNSQFFFDKIMLTLSVGGVFWMLLKWMIWMNVLLTHVYFIYSSEWPFYKYLKFAYIRPKIVLYYNFF